MDICYFLRIQGHRNRAAAEKKAAQYAPIATDADGTQGLYIDQFGF